MIRRLLDALIVLLAAAILLIATTGGLDLELGPLRIRVHDWIRPLVLLALAAGGRVFLWKAPTARYVAGGSLLALLIAIGGVYAHYHIRVAGGLDSYGYVSTAHLLASGRISQPEPLAAVLPFDGAMKAAAPLGHVPSADGRRSVPRFPLGLPLVMALFTIFGSTGPFFAPLVMGYAAAAVAYLLGRECSDGTSVNHAAGLFAAVLVAADPLFVSSAIQPMSDVPATFWLLASVWLALGAHERRVGPDLSRTFSVAAGICGGMAMLTRPALLPAVITLVLVSADRKNLRPASAFGATVAAFIALQMGLNAALYGGVTMSGYGTTSHMFALSAARLIANTSNFAKWLTYSHTPLFWLLWPGALVVLRHERKAWQISAVAGAAVAPYLFYMVFDDWQASRFVMPAIALVLILSARAVSHVLSRAALRRTGLASISHLLLLVLALAYATRSHAFLRQEGTYGLGTLEAKYALVGEWFNTNTSERAVVLAGLHSGSIRLYGKRATIRWDEIPEQALGATVQALIDAGYEPFVALDLPTEPPLFEARFKSQVAPAEQIARVRVVNIYKFVSAY